VTETPEDSRPATDASAADAADLSYDLCHEATANLRHPGKRRGPAHVIELPGAAQDAEEWPDGVPVPGDGDYGYDLARDVPRAAR
jgi:hypothetical protein